MGLRPVCFEFRVSCFTLSHLAVPTVVCDDTTLLLSTSYPLTSAPRALVCNVDLFVRPLFGRLVLPAVLEGSAPSQPAEGAGGEAARAVGVGAEAFMETECAADQAGGVGVCGGGGVEN